MEAGPSSPSLHSDLALIRTAATGRRRDDAGAGHELGHA